MARGNFGNPEQHAKAGREGGRKSRRGSSSNSQSN
jgi:hypothetical protein